MMNEPTCRPGLKAATCRRTPKMGWGARSDEPYQENTGENMRKRPKITLNHTVGRWKKAVNHTKSQLITINHIEKKLRAGRWAGQTGRVGGQEGFGGPGGGCLNLYGARPSPGAAMPGAVGRPEFTNGPLPAEKAGMAGEDVYNFPMIPRRQPSCARGPSFAPAVVETMAGAAVSRPARDQPQHSQMACLCGLATRTVGLPSNLLRLVWQTQPRPVWAAASGEKNESLCCFLWREFYSGLRLQYRNE
jgi:hypothetical protein